MADTQIVPGGVTSAPQDYTVPAAQQITLGAVFAHYNGAAAAGSFVPTLRIISDSGHTVLSVPQDVTIAAGASAESSWAPFLKTQAAAAPSGGALKACRLWTTNMAKTIGNNNNGRLTFDHVSSFDPAVFATTVQAGRVTRVHYLVKGWYSAWAQFVFNTQPATGSTGVIFVYVGDTTGQSGADYVNDGIGVNAGPYYGYSVTRYFPDELDALPGVSELWVTNLSGGNRVIDQSVWQHVFLGDSDF